MYKILLLVLLLTGCVTVLEKDPDLLNGCRVDEAEAKLGYFNQEGSLGACVLKCSKELPKNLCYKYSNPRTGCSLKIGECSDRNSE